MAQMDNDVKARVARDVLDTPQEKVCVLKRDDMLFPSFFCASIEIITIVWNLIVPLLGDAPGAMSKCLFWAFVFIHVCSTEHVYCRIVGTKDPKTF